MPFDGASTGGKRYGAGQGHLSPGSFQKDSENREMTEETWQSLLSLEIWFYLSSSTINL